MHKFEESGLGRAPFRITGWCRKVGPVRLDNGVTIGSPGQPMGNCDYCGQGIAVCVNVESSDGKQFVVGCDCAAKVYSDDNAALSEIERIRHEDARNERDRRREERRQQREQEREARLQSQRDANGGLTDWELEQKRLQDSLDAAAERASRENAWIIEVLMSAYRSDFIDAMIDKLRRQSLDCLSDRMVSAIADILAKSQSGNARRGSKKYNAALEAVEQRMGLHNV